MLRPGTRVVGTVDFRNDRFAIITPLYHESGGEWIDADPANFPTRGKVFWWGPALASSRGSAVIFELVEGHNEKDIYSVGNAQYLHPLLDYGRFPYDEAIERLTISRLPASDEVRAGLDVFAWCSYNRTGAAPDGQGLLLGPLTPHTDGDGFHIPSNSIRLERVPYREDEPAIFPLPNSRYYCFPTSPITGYLDCRPDAQILRTALKDAVALAESASAEVPDFLKTKQLINKAAGLLQDGERLDDRQYKLDRLDRALKICRDSDELRTLTREVADVLRDDPAVKLEIQRDRAAIRDQVYEEALAEVQSDIQTESTRLADLREEIATARVTLVETTELLEEARQDLDTVKAEVDRQLESVADNVTSRISELVNDASDLLSDSVLLRAIGVGGPARPEHESNYAISDPFEKRRAIAPIGGRSTADVLRTASIICGVPSDALNRIHSAVRAGLLPIVTGSGGPFALMVYARVACSGRMAELPVAHDFLHPVDLLGVRSATPSRARAHGGILLGANRSVRQAGPGLLILESFNRAPTESYLLPWLQSYDRGITVPGPARDAIGDLSRFVPHNDLVVAATAAAGATTAPASPDLWGYAVVIDVPTAGRLATDLPELSALDLSLLSDVPNTLQDFILELEDALGDIWVVDDGLIDTATRFSGQLADLQDPEEVFVSVLECVIVPALATSLSGQPLTEAVDGALAAGSPNIRKRRRQVQSLAQRLHQRFS